MNTDKPYDNFKTMYRWCVFAGTSPPVKN